ncbi:MAG: hypothetical protein PVJ75_14445, partial [Chloroflexota bacterium]
MIEMYKRTVPVALAIALGLLTVVGLLFIPALGNTLVSWAAFLAAVALLLGVINLLGVHARRIARGNPYSAALVLSMLLVFALAIGDFFGITDDGVGTVFEVVQAPLEMAMASLLAFFLLFAAFRMLQRQRTIWAALFVVTVLILLLASTALPIFLTRVIESLTDLINQV